MAGEKYQKVIFISSIPWLWFLFYLKFLVTISSDHGEELEQTLEETNWR